MKGYELLVNISRMKGPLTEDIVVPLVESLYSPK